MASAFNPTELKYLLECGICLNRFQDPRVLPCLHSYCLDCLNSHISTNKNKDGSFHCPECREKCPMSPEGADQFPKNFFVNAMKDVVPASFLQESPTGAASGPTMCTYQTDKTDEHGPAVVFCGQCDAYFCQTCEKHHKMFGVTKEHKVTEVDDAKPEQEITNPNCELHKKQQLNWFCETCSLPACPECLLEKHEGHLKEKLAVIEASIKQDMLDVSVLAAKRLEVLRKISEDLKTNERKMEQELDQVNKNITDTADDLCRLVRQHEATLKAKVTEAREEARRYFEKAEEELGTLRKNVSSIKSSAETLHNTPQEQAVFTVLQGPVSKQQIAHQQEVPIPWFQWELSKKPIESRQLRMDRLLGYLDSDKLFESNKSHQSESLMLGGPLKTIPLDYTGKHSVCSITPIFTSMVCVAHSGQKYVWVYSNEGKLEKKMDIPGIDNITGMVAVDNANGKLAIVDNRQNKIHFVTMSESLTIAAYLTKDIPRKPRCVSKSRQGQLVLSSFEGNWVGIFNQNGQIISDIEVPVPIQHDKVVLQSVCQTDAGFVISERESNNVHFTDACGNIVNTSTGFTSPWSVTETSWGHVIVADCLAHVVKAFSHKGDFLGNVCDDCNKIIAPDCLYVDESKRLLYISCGNVGKMELRVYKFTPSDLPSPPVTHNVTKLSVDISLAKV